MTPSPGEIFLVDLGMAAKYRPAVVVSRHDPAAPRAVAICIPLTTQNRGSRYEFPLGKLRFLDKESWANVQGLTSIDYSQFNRRLGHLTPQQLHGLKDTLRFVLEL